MISKPSTAVPPPPSPSTHTHKRVQAFTVMGQSSQSRHKGWCLQAPGSQAQCFPSAALRRERAHRLRTMVTSRSAGSNSTTGKL
eukprot:3939463-Rhodomonas_salina.4